MARTQSRKEGGGLKIIILLGKVTHRIKKMARGGLGSSLLEKGPFSVRNAPLSYQKLRHLQAGRKNIYLTIKGYPRLKRN